MILGQIEVIYLSFISAVYVLTFGKIRFMLTGLYIGGTKVFYFSLVLIGYVCSFV